MLHFINLLTNYVKDIRSLVKHNIARGYMLSDFFQTESERVVPLWSPSPGVIAPEGFKKTNVCVGDIGFFSKEGDFEVLFNVFLTIDENKALEFDPPDDFVPYLPRFKVSKISEISKEHHKPCFGDFKRDSDTSEKLVLFLLALVGAITHIILFVENALHHTI